MLPTSRRMGQHAPNDDDPALAGTSLGDLRSNVDVLRRQYDGACADALTLHDDWRSVTDRAAAIWRRRQATLAEIRKRETLAGKRAKRTAIAAQRQTS